MCAIFVFQLFIYYLLFDNYNCSPIYILVIILQSLCTLTSSHFLNDLIQPTEEFLYLNTSLIPSQATVYTKYWFTWSSELHFTLFTVFSSFLFFMFFLFFFLKNSAHIMSKQRLENSKEPKMISEHYMRTKELCILCTLWCSPRIRCKNGLQLQESCCDNSLLAGS